MRSVRTVRISAASTQARRSAGAPEFVNVCQAAQHGTFIAAENPDADRTWMELLFLSFTTLSSTGLSDVVPIEPFARGVVMLEQVAGVGYVAIVVSRLVGLTVLRGGSDQSAPAANVSQRPGSPPP